MSAVLTDVSQALADVVALASVGVVRIEARQRLPASGAVWSADGLVVTAHHVIETEDGITVGLADGSKRQAALVGRDPTTDIAVLKLQGGGLPTVSWKDADDLRVGHMVLALGRPGGTIRATLGIVSALGGGWRTPAGGQLDRYVQSDVTMFPGFSGGTLVDISGQFLGINTSMVLRGASLTLPTATIRRVAQALVTHGRIRRGYLGVGVQPVRLPPNLAQEVGQGSGLLVTSVETGGPGERAGLLLGDLLVKIDGQPIQAVDDLLAFLAGEKAGQRVTARILRGGAAREAPIVIGER